MRELLSSFFKSSREPVKKAAPTPPTRTFSDGSIVDAELAVKMQGVINNQCPDFVCILIPREMPLRLDVLKQVGAFLEGRSFYKIFFRHDAQTN